MSIENAREIRWLRTLLSEQQSALAETLREELQRRLDYEHERLHTLEGTPLYRTQGRAAVIAELLAMLDPDRARARLKQIEQRR